ncbi:MAG: hypothetical protein MUD12_16920 [Spirochaetes bacterium]|jgi:hypothetical protein|nr:hypothetical protein [Spirochaetota bacterium]
MFIGHYGVGLALKKADKRISLGLLFFAVSFIDLLHFILVLIGIESVEIVPGFTKWIPLTGNNPISHGLTGMIAWSFLAYAAVIIYGKIKKEDSVSSRKTAMIISLGIFSHFICDVIVHAPDLPLIGYDSIKLGFGLWNYPVISNALELGMFFTGLIIYYKSTTGDGFTAKYGLIILGIGLIVFNILIGIIPPLENVKITYLNMLVLYTAIIAAAEWLDRKRI